TDVSFHELQPGVAARVDLQARIRRALGARDGGQEYDFDLRSGTVGQRHVEHGIAARRVEPGQREIDAGRGDGVIELSGKGVAGGARVEQARGGVRRGVGREVSVDEYPAFEPG